MNLPSRKKNFRQFTVRLDDQTYQQLKVHAVNRGESMAEIARRLLTESLQTDNAVTSQNVLLSLVRAAVGKELRRTENRLANLSSKAAISAAAAENLLVYMLRIMNEPNFVAVRGECRKRGVAYVREPLEQIMQAYGDDRGEGEI